MDWSCIYMHSIQRHQHHAISQPVTIFYPNEKERKETKTTQNKNPNPILSYPTQKRLPALPFSMNPPHVILHIIHTTKNPPTALPLTSYPGVMFRLVSGAILLTREPALHGLWTSLVTTEEVLPVSVEVFAEVAAAAENGGRGAAWVCASPGAVAGGDAVAG